MGKGLNFKKLYRKKIKIIDIIAISITLVCFIALLMCSLLSFYDSMQNQKLLKENSLKQYSNQFKESIDEYIEYNFNMLEYLTNYSEVYNMDWDEQYIFLKQQEELLNFTHFIIMDLEGNGYYTNRNEIKDQSQEEFFSDIINNERFITEPFIEVYENRAITTLSVFIYNSGKKVGALCGVVDLSKVYKIFEEKMVGNEGYGFVINEDGDYIAHKNSRYVFEGNNFFQDLNKTKEDIEILKENIKNNNTNLEEVILNDIEYYAVFSTLKSKNWELVFVVPKSEFLINLNKFTIYQSLTVIFGVLLIILLRSVVKQGVKNHKLAYIDSLTNINNRASVDIMLKKLDHKNNEKVTIISFDLNDFKYINDTYGHHIGDRLLCEFSNILNDTIGKIGFVGRMGGDEFIAILTNIDIFEVERKIEEMNKLIWKYNNNSLYKIKASFGYATREVGSNDSLINIYKEADKNMYEFKSKYKKVESF